MNATVRWVIWIVATGMIVAGGFAHGWNPFRKTLLVLVIVVGVLQIVLPILQRRMLRKIKAMPPEEREKFLARFDPRTQERLRKQLEAKDV